MSTNLTWAERLTYGPPMNSHEYAEFLLFVEDAVAIQALLDDRNIDTVKELDEHFSDYDQRSHTDSEWDALADDLEEAQDEASDLMRKVEDLEDELESLKAPS